MVLQRITDRGLLAEYFRKDLALYTYCLGDLDDRYWPHTSYFGIRENEGVSHVIQLYQGEGIPVLLVLGPEDSFREELINQLEPLLPAEVYAHLTPGLERLFLKSFSLRDFGSHYKMALQEPDLMKDVSITGTIRLTEDDLAEALQLYQNSYPDNSFEPHSLASGKYTGWREDGRLVSIAGIHVYSPSYRVAALGNITTDPAFRGRGLARKVIVRLYRELASEIDFFSLNVKCSNQQAVGLYESLGFKTCAKYGEFALKRSILA